MGGRLGFPFTLIYHPTLEYYAFWNNCGQLRITNYELRDLNSKFKTSEIRNQEFSKSHKIEEWGDG
jgi:hypothetical protein